MERMNIKHQLKSYLEYRGMTAAQLARISGVSKQVLSMWLGGSQPKNLDHAKKVADALGTTVDNLCFGSGIPEREHKTTELNALFGDEWLGGTFEIKMRRVKK